MVQGWFFVAVRAHSEVPGHSGSTVILRCQGSMGIFSSDQEMELVSSFIELYAPSLGFLFQVPLYLPESRMAWEETLSV